MSFSTITVIPAYGRDYRTQKAARADWNDGKDFIVQDFFNQWDGKPINKSDAEQYLPGTKIMVRYSRLTKVVQVN